MLISLSNGLKVNVTIKYNAKTRILLRYKEGEIKISAPLYTPNKTILKLIKDNEAFILRRIDEESHQEKVIHFFGKAYEVVFLEGSKNEVILTFDKIYLKSKVQDLKHYELLLRKFYLEHLKAYVNQELIYDLEKDYEGIIIPQIKYKYMKSCFGNYYKDKHLINLSTMLAKYDKLYIKCVLYHEMSHIFEMNHSERFYQVFENKFPGARQIQHALKMIKYNDIL